MWINLQAGWIGLLLGGIAGAAAGLFFHRENWLGGYASWPRRMIRLAHISLFGLGFLNLAFALSAKTVGMVSGIRGPSVLLVVGAVAMPVVCCLAAWKPAFRHLFFLPAGAVLLGIALFLSKLLSA